MSKLCRRGLSVEIKVVPGRWRATQHGAQAAVSRHHLINFAPRSRSSKGITHRYAMFVKNWGTLKSIQGSAQRAPRG